MELLILEKYVMVPIGAILLIVRILATSQVEHLLAIHAAYSIHLNAQVILGFVVTGSLILEKHVMAQTGDQFFNAQSSINLQVAHFSVTQTVTLTLETAYLPYAETGSCTQHLMKCVMMETQATQMRV